MLTRKELSRRRFLRGAGGITLGLPYLMPDPKAYGQTAFPKRFLLFFVCEGVEPTYYYPTAPLALSTPIAQCGFAQSSLQGNDTTKGILSPLAGSSTLARDKITIVKGLDHSVTRRFSGCYHGFCMPQVLTGGNDSPAQTYDGISHQGGVSVDRMLGRHIKGTATYQSYELGVMNTAGGGNAIISYDSKGARRLAVNSPYKAMTELFGAAGTGDPAAQQAQLELHNRRKSVLDVLKDDIARLRCVVGRDGASKLDAHMQSVREVEQQIVDAATNGGTVSVSVPKEFEAPNVYNQYARTPDVAKWQMKLAALGLSSGAMRVGTVQFMQTVSRQKFNAWLPVKMQPTYDFHDRISHFLPEHREMALADRKIIYGWFHEQYKAMMDELNVIPEGNGTLLDNTALVYSSEMSVGNEHNYINIPTIIAGGAQRSLKIGYYINLEANRTPHRSMNDFWLTILHAFGVMVPKFGETAFCSGPITDLLA